MFNSAIRFGRKIGSASLDDVRKATSVSRARGIRSVAGTSSPRAAGHAGSAASRQILRSANSQISGLRTKTSRYMGQHPRIVRTGQIAAAGMGVAAAVRSGTGRPVDKGTQSMYRY